MFFFVKINQIPILEIFTRYVYPKLQFFLKVSLYSLYIQLYITVVNKLVANNDYTFHDTIFESFSYIHS